FYPVFPRVSADVAITVMERAEKPDPSHVVNIFRSTAPDVTVVAPTVPESAWRSHPKNEFLTDVHPAADALLAKVEKKSVPLGSFATAYFGIQTFDRNRYV